MMLNCMWLSLWTTNFFTGAGVTPDPGFWHGLMVVPVLVTLPLLLSVVRSSAKLYGFVRLDHEALGGVIEVMEDVEDMQSIMKSKLLARLDKLKEERGRELTTAERTAFVKKLISIVDLDGSGKLPFFVFRKFVRMFGITSRFA